MTCSKKCQRGITVEGCPNHSSMFHFFATFNAFGHRWIETASERATV